MGIRRLLKPTIYSQRSENGVRIKKERTKEAVEEEWQTYQKLKEVLVRFCDDELNGLTAVND